MIIVKKLMGRITRNKELLSAYKSPDANTAVKRVLLNAMDNTAEYNNIKQLGQAVAPASATSRMAGTALEDLGVDISPNSKRTEAGLFNRHKLGDKDYRSVAAEHKLRIANEMAGGGYSREDLVDMLNSPGVQQAEPFRNALSNDAALAELNDFDAQGGFIRPEMESPSFVGEGQFGRVSELAPGYVSKKQAPLVEFNGYQRSEDGDQLPYGNVLPPGNDSFFRIQDYRDVKDEVNDLNYLNSRGKGITPKVEKLIIEDDGSTEVIMRDLRDNYEGSEAFLDNKLFQVKRKQQEAQAALLGIELQDRHAGNVMSHKMMKRPLQIDPTGRPVDGLEQDATVIRNVIDGFSAAGLEQEADIFMGLASEAARSGNNSAVHDLAQQGMSRLMKIKRV